MFQITSLLRRAARAETSSFMLPRITLLLTFEGEDRLITSVRCIMENLSGEFRLFDQVLPGNDDSNCAPILAPILDQSAPALIVLCVARERRTQAESVIGFIRKAVPDVPLMTVLESTEVEDISALINVGATDFIMPPLRACDLLARLRRWGGGSKEKAEAPAQLRERLGLQQFVGESALLAEAINLVPRLARCDASVFIRGETGTGKEMFARAIHYLGTRAAQPFIPINCGAIPTELVENELFGHERGAFTGAMTSSRGLIHEADGGTLFLDEIDSLPLLTQVKLLRFLQDRTYRPLGAKKTVQANVRIIAASNAEIEDAVRGGTFRSDLFYRINILTMKLPPLRERKEDIPLLARHFVAKHVCESTASSLEISPAALQKLLGYDWPGNVRELENIIQRAVVLCEGATIRGSDIALPETTPVECDSFKVLKARVIVDFERNYLRRLLADNQGNISKAARAANKDRRAFWQLLRKYNLHLHAEPLTAERMDNFRLRQDKKVRVETARLAADL